MELGDSPVVQVWEGSASQSFTGFTGFTGALGGLGRANSVGLWIPSEAPPEQEGEHRGKDPQDDKDSPQDAMKIHDVHGWSTVDLIEKVRIYQLRVLEASSALNGINLSHFCARRK